MPALPIFLQKGGEKPQKVLMQVRKHVIDFILFLDLRRKRSRE
jgi:hypothetical protein